VLGVEVWAEIRRRHFVDGVGVRPLSREFGLDRKTIRRALAASEPPRYVRRVRRGSKLDPFKAEIARLLRDDASLPAERVFELLREQGYEGGRTTLGDHLREVRPVISPPRTFQRTSYRPGEVAQFDLWQPSRPIRVGYGQERVGFVVVAALGYSRVSAGALVFSKETPEVLWGIGRCLERLGGVPGRLVWDREAAVHAGGGRPVGAFAALCGAFGTGWQFCRPRDPQAKGVVERLQGFCETSFEPARRFANAQDFQLQLDEWFERRANVRQHRALRCRPVDRLAEERERLRPLPAPLPDTDRRLVLRVPPDPYLRFDSCDYSLDPRLAGRRVEVRISQRELVGVVLGSGEVACRHVRSYARHRTITDPAHQAALEALRDQRHGGRVGAARDEATVERRPLSRYDALIPA
jgi:transposase